MLDEVHNGPLTETQLEGIIYRGLGWGLLVTF